MAERRSVRFQKDLFSEADEIQIESGDISQAVCDRLNTFYRLKLKKDEAFLVVRSQNKFCGTIVSRDIPLQMALRELKDLKKNNYRVVLMIYTFPALVPSRVIGHKTESEILLFDKNANICTLNVLMSDFLDLSHKKEAYFRYTMIEDGVRRTLNSSKTLAFYQFQEATQSLEIMNVADFEKNAMEEAVNMKDCQQDGEVTLKKKFKGKDLKPVVCHAVLRDAVLYFCRSAQDPKPAEGVLCLDYFTYQIDKIDGEDTIILETASNNFDFKRRATPTLNGSQSTTLTPEVKKKERRNSISTKRFSGKEMTYTAYDIESYQIVPKNKTTFLAWSDAIRSHTRNTTNDVVFGTTLTDLMTRDVNAGRTIPHILEDCIRFLDNPEYIDEEGIFRKTGTLSTVEELIKSYDEGRAVVLNDIPGMDCHTASSIIKRWLGRLGDPLLFPYDDFIANAAECDDLNLAECPKMQALLLKLPLANMEAISFLCSFLNKVSLRQEVNKMTVNNLAVVIGPNALRRRGGQDTTQLGDSNKVINIFGTLIQCHDIVKNILSEIQKKNEEENAKHRSKADAIQDAIKKSAVANLGVTFGSSDFGFLGEF